MGTARSGFHPPGTETDLRGASKDYLEVIEKMRWYQKEMNENILYLEVP
jgi:hypothetical protein